MEKANDVLTSILIALVLTGISYFVGLKMRWISAVDWLEAFCVFTSYSCTYLCVRQSRLNYIVGAVSTASLTWLFWKQGLYASALLNAYLVPTLVYGWFRWGPDTDTRPVTRLAADRWLLVYAAVTGGTYTALLLITRAMGATLPLLDSAILVLSILAQFLLDNKKLENWMVWVVVNDISIWTYANSGLTLVAFQYVFFLLNTAWGLLSWRRSMNAYA